MDGILVGKLIFTCSFQKVKHPMKFSLLVLVLIAGGVRLSGQAERCGSALQRLSEKDFAAAHAFSQRTVAPFPKSNLVDSVAVSIHIVGSQSQDPFAFPLAALEAEIDLINRAFEDSGILFFICGSPLYMDGDLTFNFDSGDALNRREYVPNTINVYFVDNVTSNSGLSLCGYAQLPFIGEEADRYIMMNKDCATDGATLIHEFGHFYGLFHTHETRFGREFVDGSNCTTAGDQVCDTAADPDLSNPDLMSGCNYIGKILDPKGTIYLPPVTNFMSYAPSSCQSFFTTGQSELMRDVHLKENAYLMRDCNFYPDLAIRQDQDLIQIRSDETISITYDLEQLGFDQDHDVTLKITLADNPEKIGTVLHEEQLKIEPENEAYSLSFQLDFPIVKGSGTYYLQGLIDANGEVVERSEKNNLALTTVKVDNSQFDDGLLFPNPVHNEVKVFLRTAEAFQRLNIRIYRYDGRLMMKQQDFKNQKEFFRVMDISSFQPGLYLLTVDFEKSDKSYAFKFFKR